MTIEFNARIPESQAIRRAQRAAQLAGVDSSKHLSEVARIAEVARMIRRRPAVEAVVADEAKALAASTPETALAALDDAAARIARADAQRSLASKTLVGLEGQYLAAASEAVDAIMADLQAPAASAATKIGDVLAKPPAIDWLDPAEVLAAGQGKSWETLRAGLDLLLAVAAAVPDDAGYVASDREALVCRLFEIPDGEDAPERAVRVLGATPERWIHARTLGSQHLGRPPEPPSHRRVLLDAIADGWTLAVATRRQVERRSRDLAQVLTLPGSHGVELRAI